MTYPRELYATEVVFLTDAQDSSMLNQNELSDISRVVAHNLDCLISRGKVGILARKFTDAFIPKTSRLVVGTATIQRNYYVGHFDGLYTVLLLDYSKFITCRVYYKQNPNGAHRFRDMADESYTGWCVVEIVRSV